LSRVIKRAAHVLVACALLCSMAACATGPPRSAEQLQADKELATRVEDALDKEKMLYAKHILVRAYNGKVTLTGYVWDPPDLLLAETIAGDVQGVTQVENKLELQLNGIDDSPVTR
jgi:osmotically-inducible protein OsmY